VRSVRALVLVSFGMLVMAAGVGMAQQAATLDDAAIKQAIDLGKRKKVPDTKLEKTASLGSYRLHVADFSTPFLRIAAAARAAQVSYQPFDASHITDEMRAPELHIYAWPQMDGAEAVGVRAVVITPRKGNKEEKMAKAIQPTRFEDMPMTFKNLFGAKFEGTGRMAVFPLSALSEENEVHVVYERSVKLDVDGSPMVKLSCEDCDVKFSLGKNIR
jgi:hypothetical protein